MDATLRRNQDQNWRQNLKQGKKLDLNGGNSSNKTKDRNRWSRFLQLELKQDSEYPQLELIFIDSLNKVQLVLTKVTPNEPQLSLYING